MYRYQLWLSIITKGEKDWLSLVSAGYNPNHIAKSACEQAEYKQVCRIVSSDRFTADQHEVQNDKADTGKR